jgi:hypothetical protein
VDFERHKTVARNLPDFLNPAAPDAGTQKLRETLSYFRVNKFARQTVKPRASRGKVDIQAESVPGLVGADACSPWHPWLEEFQHKAVKIRLAYVLNAAALKGKLRENFFDFFPVKRHTLA